MERVTESDSRYDNLEQMPLIDLLKNINKEDKTVPEAIEKAIPEIENMINAIVPLLQEGGRLFYTGAGTSGRLGIVDASECPPTFGITQGIVIGIIAGGDSAIRKAVEFAEDSIIQGWHDLQKYNICEKDFVIGIAASGSTPYVIGALTNCRKNKIKTGCITCNPGSALAKEADFPVEVITGPEFVTGSTRMKAGTAQKLILNMVSTAVMIRLGKVKGNKMVDMLLSNNKLINRGTRMIMTSLNIDEDRAAKLLKQYGSVREVLNHHLNS